MSTPTPQEVDALLARGLQDLWYPICPSSFVKERPVSLKRLGHKLALWRDNDGNVHALRDRCPHRGAPLSQGVNMGDRLACPYHGIEVRCDGTVTSVPASPGCTLEGKRAALAFHTREAHGAIWIYNASEPVDEPPPLVLPDELTSPEYSSFLCYSEWRCDYRYAVDNVMDPMHGTFLHKMSHSMAEGDISAKFQLRRTEHGFVFEKAGQRDMNFDWTEFADTGAQWLRLEIPYPKTGGPGGNFAIIGFAVPITNELCGVFFWRCRRVSDWMRDTWRFLYRNRLEARHWAVLEQDRVVLESMEPDAWDHEHLYDHDVGLSRLRRHLQNQAIKQINAKAARAAQGTPVAAPASLKESAAA